MPDHEGEVPPAHLRGVNFDGWLLLEKWMTQRLNPPASLFIPIKVSWAERSNPNPIEKINDEDALAPSLSQLADARFNFRAWINKSDPTDVAMPVQQMQMSYFCATP